jgi:hypothetical protein
MPLPLEIITSNGKQKTTIGKEGITVQSAVPPQVDPNGNYLKKITLIP